MPARKEQRVAIERPHPGDDAIGARAYSCRGLAAGTPIPEQLPVRAFAANLLCGSTFVVAVVPLEQITVDFRGGAKARQLAGPRGTLERAREHPREDYAPQTLAE